VTVHVEGGGVHFSKGYGYVDGGSSGALDPAEQFSADTAAVFTFTPGDVAISADYLGTTSATRHVTAVPGDSAGGTSGTSGTSGSTGSTGTSKPSVPKFGCSAGGAGVALIALLPLLGLRRRRG
jgi:Synergist-CTERM protein sorting domain-containing protein